MLQIFIQIYVVCLCHFYDCEIQGIGIRTIRPFCVGKKNWVMIDTVAGAEASAMIYSIAETAKANNLKPYNYFKYLLEEIPRHMDDHGVDFCEKLLPWSDKLPAECRK